MASKNVLPKFDMIEGSNQKTLDGDYPQYSTYKHVFETISKIALIYGELSSKRNGTIWHIFHILLFLTKIFKNRAFINSIAPF